jgi:uncharacterized protein YggE
MSLRFGACLPATIRTIAGTLVCFCASQGPGGAQSFPRDVPGITVSGRATLTAHADPLYVSAVLGPASMPPKQQAPTDIDAATAAVLAALRGAGLGGATISYIVDPFGTRRSIAGTIHDPTAANFAAVTHVVTDALQPYPDVALRGLRAVLGLANCTDVEKRLQAAAIADARARAERLAAGAGVSIGAPTIITPGGLPGYAFPCEPSQMMPEGLPLEALSGVGGLPESGDVTYGLFVNVTYSIVPH